MNTQTIEKVVDTCDTLDVIDIWKTLQGEGPFVGMPAVFVRLAGCTLQCPACDTDYTTGRRMMTRVSIIEKIKDVEMVSDQRAITPLIVFTGGEPLRQNIIPLVGDLNQIGFKCQVETNGAVFRPLPYSTTIVCSPKTTRINDRLIPMINAYKYVIEAGKVDPEDGLPLSALQMNQKPFRPQNLRQFTSEGAIYVQPLDTGNHDLNKVHVDAALQSCMKFGYRMCLQTHKILGLK